MENENIQESVDKIKKDTENLVKEERVSELIKNNAIEFTYKDKKYRVKKPNFEQKYKVSLEQSRKYIEMLKDPQYVLESDLIKIYESRGISIKELDDKFNAMRSRREELDKKLGKALEEKKPEEECEVFKKEIEQIKEELKTVVMEKSVLLNSSLESQLSTYSYTYLAYLITEIFVQGKDLGDGSKEPDPGWTCAWKNYEEFLKEDENLVNVLVWYTMFIGKDEIALPSVL